MKIKKPEIYYLLIAALMISFLILGYCYADQQKYFARDEVPPKGKLEIIEELINQLVYVEEGCFEMGCGDWSTDCRKNEKPVHEVCIDSFWMSKYEVSQSQWSAFMDYNPSVFKLGGNHPVENVTWNEVQFFISSLNGFSGKSFRIPTEAEWEFAARDKGKNIRYPWGNTLGSNNANCRTCGSKWDNKSTSPVGSFKPNSLGIYDMSGNVYEWCLDFHSPNYYEVSPKDNPQGPSNGTSHSTRGASWKSKATHIRTTNRAGSIPTARLDHLGFRLVLPSK